MFDLEELSCASMVEDAQGMNNKPDFPWTKKSKAERGKITMENVVKQHVPTGFQSAKAEVMKLEPTSCLWKDPFVVSTSNSLCQKHQCRQLGRFCYK